jgi:hypothetical protein
MTNEEALRILHCPSAYLTDEDSELAHTIPMFSKAYGQAMAVAFEALKQANALDKIRAEIDRQQKWLLQAGYTMYNVDIAFDAIKAVVAESEDKR